MQSFIDRTIASCRSAFSKYSSRRFASLSRIEQAMMVLSTFALVISVSFVIGTGPSVQDYLLRLLKSETASIYGSAYQNGLSLFPSLRNWLLSALSWPFLVGAILIVCGSLHRSRARDVFFSAMVISFFSLLFLDLSNALLNGSLSVEYLFENALANFVGSPVVALAFTSIVLLGKVCVDKIVGSLVWRQFVASVVTVLAGVSICSLMYYGADLLYRAVPVQLDAIIDAPANGVIASPPEHERSAQKGDDEDGEGRFFPLPTQPAKQSELRWKLGTETPLSVSWASTVGSRSFNVTIEFVADCADEEFQLLRKIDENIVRFADVSNLRIALDGEMGEFATIGRNSLDGAIELSGVSLAMFSLDRDTETRRRKTTLSTNEPMEIRHKSNANEISFYLNAILAKADGEQIVVADRNYQVEIDGRKYTITGANRLGSSERVGDRKCRTLRTGMNVLRGGAATLSGATTYAGLRVRITKKSDAPVQLPHSLLTIRGQGGWLTLTQPDNKDDTASGKGGAEFIAFKGNIANFDIAGSSTSVRSTDEFTAFGDFRGRFEDGSRIRLTGQAKALWKNSVRVNPTKWEQLSEVVKLAAVGALWAGLIATMAFLWRIIKRNNDIDWRQVRKSEIPKS